jgi:hypothetical protein
MKHSLHQLPTFLEIHWVSDMLHVAGKTNTYTMTSPFYDHFMSIVEVVHTDLVDMTFRRYQ